MSKSPCSRTLPHEAREQGVFNFLPFLIIYYEHEKAPSITILFIPVYLLFNAQKYGACELKETDETLSFPIDSDTKNNFNIYSVYKDKDGKEYFTFQNIENNTIHFYDLKQQKPAFRITPSQEGSNGVGRIFGYYIQNLDSIYVFNFYESGLYLINKNCDLLDKQPFLGLKPSCFMATASQLPVRIEHTLYTCIEPNRLIEHDPVSVAINMNTKEEKKLPFDYPDYPGSEVKLKRYGMEASYSRCYDGQRFIYSFHYDENIYVATPEHDSIRKVPVRSKYFDKVQLPDELTASPEDFCVNAWYNNLLYDPYREVYYRIAYPPSTLDKGVRPMELVQFGRKNFSIIILDKDFRILGETLFPDNTYNPTIMLVRPEGLYISDSHYLNPQFNDDILSFRKFELKEE